MARLSDEAAIGGLRPRADLTIADAAKLFGDRLLLVVMTGMGKDGLDGAREVRARGGRILAEAESSCTVYGMPRAIVEARLADVVVPLGELAEAIAAEIGRMSHRHLQRRRCAARGDEYVAFCNALRHVCGIDLLQYKRGQMERRIRSFAATRGAADLAAYATTLRTDKEELREVPRPRDDQRLAPVAQPGAVGDAGGADPPRPRRDGAPRQPHPRLVGRLLLRRRGLHLGRDRAPRHPARAWSRSWAPTSTPGWWQRARTGVFSIEDARDAPTATLAGHFELADGRWHASEELKRLVRFEQGDLLTIAPLAGRLRPRALPQHRHLLQRGRARRAARPAGRRACAPGGRLVVGATERVSEPARHGLAPESPFVYRKL